MLEIKIFNVDHGFCTVIQLNNKHTILLDCGYNFCSGFRPARYLLNHDFQHLDYLIVPAYTEGHLAGFIDFNNHFSEGHFSINCLITNPSINDNNIYNLAGGNLDLFHELKVLSKIKYLCKEIDQTVQWENTNIAFFCNFYSSSANLYNLSLVTFLFYKNVRIIFPSDLKTDGWQSLLKNPQFCDLLSQVNLFVASNHGQESGYCSEVFDYCKPELVIISNHGHRQLPLAALRQYELHAQGLQISAGKQKVLTTRNDGTIHIVQDENSSLKVFAQKHEIYSY